MPKKRLTIDDVYQHFSKMETLPHRDLVDVEKILSGYTNRAISDQARYTHQSDIGVAARTEREVRPDTKLRAYEKAEKEILPAKKQVMSAISTYPDDRLKDTLPVVVAQVNESPYLAGAYQRKLKYDKPNGVAVALVGGNDYKRHGYLPSSAMSHELAHAYDYGSTSYSGPSSARAEDMFNDRVLQSYVDGSPIQGDARYNESPSEAFANYMMNAYETDQLSKSNYEENARRAVSSAEEKERVLLKNKNVKN